MKKKGIKNTCGILILPIGSGLSGNCQQSGGPRSAINAEKVIFSAWGINERKAKKMPYGDSREWSSAVWKTSVSKFRRSQ